MRTQPLVAAVDVTLGFLLALGFAVQAAEVKVVSALALKPVMEDLGPKFERETGHKLAVTFATLGEAMKRLQAGEVADVVILPRDGIDTLAKGGRLDASGATPVAMSGSGVVVRKGSAKPDISTPEAFKRALLAAKSITYTHPKHGGASGPHIVKVFERLGIADDMKPKTVFPEVAGGAAVGALVANGEAELGIQQIQELIPVAGIEVVGPLPAELQNNLVFAAAVMAGTSDAQASKALVDFLHAPQSAAVFKAKGMEPATP
jgi:molybdate transport system substrate-binding protein